MSIPQVRQQGEAVLLYSSPDPIMGYEKLTKKQALELADDLIDAAEGATDADPSDG